MPHESAELILDYLREQMPRYPFKPDLDKPYVEELLADFQDVSVLNEIKAFRWYYDNQPLARVSHIRVASGAGSHERPPSRAVPHNQSEGNPYGPRLERVCCLLAITGHSQTARSRVKGPAPRRTSASELALDAARTGE